MKMLLIILLIEKISIFYIYYIEFIWYVFSESILYKMGKKNLFKKCEGFYLNERGSLVKEKKVSEREKSYGFKKIRIRNCENL